jgi:hypothetical protein
MLGMNDGGYTSFNPQVLAPFEAGYKKLLTLLQAAAPQARITLLENTAYDEITHGTEFPGYMNTTERIAAGTRSLGEFEKMPVTDTEAPSRSSSCRRRGHSRYWRNSLFPTVFIPWQPRIGSWQ